MNIVEVKDLTKIYRTKKKQPGLAAAIKSLFAADDAYTTALEKVSFSVTEGEIFGVLGANGAGKTTIFKTLSGVLYPSEGHISVCGYTPWLRENEFKKQIGMVTGQKNQLIWDLTPMDSFLWLKKIYQIPNKQFDKTLENLSQILDIEEKLNTQIRRLSFGQRMKTEFIACILHGPKIIFLDEPTIGLDVVTQNRLHSFIKEYNKSAGTTILLTSHNMKDIEKLCSKVIILSRGKIIYNGSISGIIEKYSDEKILTFRLNSGELCHSDLMKYVELSDEEMNTYIFRVPRDSYKQVASFIWSNYDVADLNVKDIEIDEVIERLLIKHN